MGSLAKHIIFDLAMLALMGLVLALIHFGVFGRGSRGFWLDDRSISWPHVDHETVPMSYASIWVIGGPLAVIAIFTVFVDRFFKQQSWAHHSSELFPVHPQDIGGVMIHPSGPEWASFSNAAQPQPLVPECSTQYTAQKQLPPPSTRVSWGTTNIPGQSILARKTRFLAYQVYVFAFCLTLTLLISNTLKQIVSRMRPDFISWCNPIPTASGYIRPDSIEHICKGDAHDVLEAQKSFPSGHSSSTMVSSMFIVIYLFKRFWNRGRREFGAGFVPTMMTLSLLVSLAIAASRNIDHRHHATDIVFGLIIGFICALVSLSFDPFTPSWEYDGTIQLKSYIYDEATRTDIQSHAQMQPLTSDLV